MITPFTRDYDNILLQLALIGDPDECAFSGPGPLLPCDHEALRSFALSSSEGGGNVIGSSSTGSIHRSSSTAGARRQ